MTQEATQITTTPPLPGLQLVQDLNKALQTLGTDFAGSSDPAALAWPYATWADTGTGTIKRRTAADSGWAIEGRLFRAHLPMYALGDVPTTDIGPIYIIGGGPAEWDGAAYEVLVPDIPTMDEMQWLGTPIGGYITPLSPPPRDNPRFRYVLCSAGENGAGKYNEGVLTGETVTGTAPLVTATATVSLVGSPLNGQTIPLINSEGRFVGAGVTEALENDMLQTFSIEVPATGHDSGGVSLSKLGISMSWQSGLARLTGNPRMGNRTQPRTHRLPHYRRIL